MNRADNGERRAGRDQRDTVNGYHFHTEKAGTCGTASQSTTRTGIMETP